MRWHILGLGSIGSLSALRLLENGHQISALPRTPNGVLSRTLKRSQQPSTTITVPCIDQEPIEYLLITVKAAVTDLALTPWLKRLSHSATIVCLQNGMGTLEKIRFPDNATVLYATTTDGVWRDADQINVVAENTTYIGAVNNISPPDWLSTLTPHWPGLIWHHDIQQALWLKLSINAVINPLTALQQCQNGELLDNGPRQRAMRELADEIDQLCLTLLDDWPADTYARCCAVAQQTAQNTSSMCADVQAGRVTEINYINGFLLRRAAEHDMVLTHNAAVTERINALSV